MKKALFLALFLAFIFPNSSFAEKYKIDIEGSHAFIQFRVKHLGYSWLYGRFNKFDGSFNIDKDNLSKSSIELTIDPASVDSNHAERDKHLKGEDFLYVSEYPQASFKSTSVKIMPENSAIITGDLTLRGVTKSVDIKVNLVGEGKDPWGGYRMGFEGSTSFALKDFGINKDLGPLSTNVEMLLSIEGIRL
jgi:polyisoprenoid-binding protein YceI